MSIIANPDATHSLASAVRYAGVTLVGSMSIGAYPLFALGCHMLVVPFVPTTFLVPSVYTTFLVPSGCTMCVVPFGCTQKAHMDCGVGVHIVCTLWPLLAGIGSPLVSRYVQRTDGWAHPYSCLMDPCRHGSLLHLCFALQVCRSRRPQVSSSGSCTTLPSLPRTSPFCYQTRVPPVLWDTMPRRHYGLLSCLLTSQTPL